MTEPLTELERETLFYLASGYGVREIAEQKLHKSTESVNLYIKSARRKLGAKSRAQLIAIAVSKRLF